MGTREKRNSAVLLPQNLLEFLGNVFEEVAVSPRQTEEMEVPQSGEMCQAQYIDQSVRPKGETSH